MAEQTTPVYLVHGLLGTSYAHFGAQVRAWSGRHRVVPVDLPGHGRCRVDAGDPYLAEALDYLTRVVRRFGAGRLVAASYLGGPLAVRLATARADLVHSVVLTGFAPELTRQVFLAWLAGFEELAAANLELAAEYDRVHQRRWRETMSAFAADIRLRYEQAALVTRDDLAALGMPLLIANGSLKSVEVSAARAAAGLGPGAHGVVIDGAGHIASNDAPEEFNRVVEQFWAAA